MRLSLRWQLGLLIPCAALAAASLHAGSGQAGPRHHRLPEPWSQLTQAQQQALFKVRRDWELRSYPQRLALLKNRQLCLRDAATLEAYRRCRSGAPGTIAHKKAALEGAASGLGSG